MSTPIWLSLISCPFKTFSVCFSVSYRIVCYGITSEQVYNCIIYLNCGERIQRSTCIFRRIYVLWVVFREKLFIAVAARRPVLVNSLQVYIFTWRPRNSVVLSMIVAHVGPVLTHAYLMPYAWLWVQLLIRRREGMVATPGHGTVRTGISGQTGFTWPGTEVLV